jgi:hypothetical protein
MDQISRSKEELISDLIQPQKSYDALKEYFESDFQLLRNAENNICKSEEKFRKAFINSPDSGSISRMSDGRLVSVNELYQNNGLFRKVDNCPEEVY